MFLRTLVLDRRADGKVPTDDGGIEVDIRRAAGERRMLAHEVKIIEVASDVVPQPISASVKNHAILLSVVIIWLVLAPRRLHHDITCERISSKKITITMLMQQQQTATAAKYFPIHSTPHRRTDLNFEAINNREVERMYLGQVLT